MSKKGTLKSLTGRGTVKRTLDRRVDEIEKRVEFLMKQLFDLESKLANFAASLKEVVQANNSVTLVASCVERFLDERFGENWDEGVRREAERRAELLARRREIMIRTKRGKELKIDERNALARELWRIARDLDVRADDTAAVVALHLQNGDVESSLDVVEEVRRDGVTLSEELSGLLNQLIARCVEVAEKGGNDILARRARSLAQISPG